MDTVIKTGEPAPDFSLPDLNGEVHNLKDALGKIVVVNFWSAECPWAERADGQILTMMEDWEEEVLLLPIASNANEPIEDLVRVAGLRGIPLVLRDADQKVATLYGAVTTPHIFVIDREAILRYQGAFDDVTFGQLEPTVNYLKIAVEAVRVGKEPEPAQVPSYGCTVVYFPMG